MNYNSMPLKFTCSHKAISNEDNKIKSIRVEVYKTVCKVVGNWLQTPVGRQFYANIHKRDFNAEIEAINTFLSLRTVRFNRTQLAEKKVNLFSYQEDKNDIFLLKAVFKYCGVSEMLVKRIAEYLKLFESAPRQSPLLLEFISVELCIETFSLAESFQEILLLQPNRISVNEIPFQRKSFAKKGTPQLTRFKRIDDLIQRVKPDSKVIDRSVVISVLGEYGPNSMSIQEYLHENSFYTDSTGGAVLVVNDPNGDFTAGFLSFFKFMKCFNCSYDYINPSPTVPSLKSLDLFKIQCAERINSVLTETLVGDFTQPANNSTIVQYLEQITSGNTLTIFINYNHVVQKKLTPSQLTEIIEKFYLDKLHPKGTVLIRMNRSYPKDFGTLLGQLALLFKNISLNYTCRNTRNHPDLIITCYSKQIPSYSGVNVSQQCLSKIQQIITDNTPESRIYANLWNQDTDYKFIKHLIKKYRRLPRNLFDNTFQTILQATVHLDSERKFDTWVQEAIIRYDGDIKLIRHLLANMLPEEYMENFDYNSGRLYIKLFWGAILTRHFLYVIQTLTSPAEMLTQLFCNYFIGFSALYRLYYQEYFPKLTYANCCKILGYEWICEDYYKYHMFSFRFVIWNVVRFIPE